MTVFLHNMEYENSLKQEFEFKTGKFDNADV